MQKDKAQDIPEDIPEDVLEVGSSEADGSQERAALDTNESLDFGEVQQIIAALGSDWAFVIRIDPDGAWQREWVGGEIPAGPGVEIEDLRSEPWDAYVVDEDREASFAHFRRAIETGRDRIEYRLDLPSIGVRCFESSIRSVRPSAKGEPIRIYGAMRDVTDRRRTEDALRKSESQYRALVEQASDGIVVFDESGQILTSNHSAHQILGLSRDGLESKRISELFHPEDSERDPLALQNLAAGVTLRSVRRLRHAKDNHWLWAELTARQLQDGHVQATLRDITARMEAERRIRNLAYFDSLTSLPNRELFHEQIDDALERAKRGDKQLALLFLDVDRFKQVNDSLGHSIGDELLIRIAERLRSAVRGSDSVGRAGCESGDDQERTGPISRLGGDEFTILLQDLEHAQDAARVGRRVLHSLSRPVEIGDREIFVGASIGIAVWPEDGATSEDLLRSADIAMYHAKSRGGNTYEFFNSTMNAALTRRLTIESAMRRALERDEFHLLFQPIRDARTGRVSAAEALIRWVDAEGNTIGPDEFIPIAEETGLIVEIGAWVLRSACQQAVEWRRRGFAPVRLSVNLSVEQLRDMGIANAVDQVLYDTGLSVDDLELEITESSILDESPNIVAAIGQLTELGISFALDDFGTGYSSLSALQRFPIDRLKIDRSFVSGVGDNKSDEALTSAIVALAKRLDLLVVAEGVETEFQAEFLVSLGCDELQGYLFSRPLPPEEFEAYLRREEKSEVARPEGAR